MKTGLLQLVLVSVVLLFTACASGPEAREKDGVSQQATASPIESAITEIENLGQIERALRSGSSARTLLVLDIDDTLLTSPVFFGSDRWYEWLKELPEGHPALVNCRFDVIAMNYESGTQVTTQTDGPAIINALPGDKLILTSRSAVSRGATIRELTKAGYRLPASLSGSEDGLIYELSVDDKAPPRLVSYHQGLFLTGGLDKGVALLDLLKRVNRTYDRVVLVDDGERNIQNMRRALSGAGIAYHGLWYKGVRKTHSAEDELAAMRGWKALREFLSATFPERAQRLAASDCAY